MSKELTGKHVFIMLSVFFGIIFSASGMLVYQATSSWTGLETKDAFRKGLKYNQQLSKSQAQNNLGWTMTVTRKKLPLDGLSLQASPKDNKGESLSGLHINVLLKRPTHTGIDRTLQLQETDLGLYTGQFKTLPLGKWYLHITADRGSDILYRSKNELYLR
ncbi:MAG: FixH family protein [Hyphomicrobiaceae bacterium]|nr:FixH family protein [Hyphomicrobiaceae bacterium]